MAEKTLTPREEILKVASERHGISPTYFINPAPVKIGEVEYTPQVNNRTFILLSTYLSSLADRSLSKQEVMQIAIGDTRTLEQERYITLAVLNTGKLTQPTEKEILRMEQINASDAINISFDTKMYYFLVYHYFIMTERALTSKKKI